MDADLAKAIQGEYSAILCYEQLAAMAPNEEVRKRILEIRGDEIRHYQQFAQAYANLTGRVWTLQAPEPCTGDYPARLAAALKDEQETVDFYLDLSERIRDPFVAQQIRRAAADEQNHAVWFLYFYVDALHGARALRG